MATALGEEEEEDEVAEMELEEEKMRLRELDEAKRDYRYVWTSGCWGGRERELTRGKEGGRIVGRIC